MNKITSALLLLGLTSSSAVFAQFKIPGMEATTKAVGEERIPVYQVMLPMSEDVGEMWSDFVKDEADVKVSDRKGVWKSNAFPVPGSDKEGVLQSWFVQKNDSTQMQVNMALGTNIYTNQVGFEKENEYLMNLLADFDYEVRKEYFEKRIKEIKKKRKEMKRAARKLSGYVKDNDKAIKEAKKEAEDNPAQKNQLLGKAKDLENKNEGLRQEIEVKKKQIKSLANEEKEAEAQLKKLEAENEK